MISIRQHLRSNRVLFYSILLLALYAIRIPFYPLISFLQTQTADFVAVAFWAVYIVMQTAALFCPVYMFGTALSLRDGWRAPLGIFLIYALMELAFQTLFSVITYHTLPLTQFVTVLGVNLLNWAIFALAMLALLALSLLWLKSANDGRSESYFSIRNREHLCLFLFTAVFFVQKTVVELIELYQIKVEYAWLEESDIRTCVVNIVAYFVILALCFFATRGILFHQYKRTAKTEPAPRPRKGNETDRRR